MVGIFDRGCGLCKFGGAIVALVGIYEIMDSLDIVENTHGPEWLKGVGGLVLTLYGVASFVYNLTKNEEE